MSKTEKVQTGVLVRVQVVKEMVTESSKLSSPKHLHQSIGSNFLRRERLNYI